MSSSESDSNSGTPQPPAPGSEPGVPSSPESAATPPSSDGNVYTPIDPVSSSGGSITYNHAAKPGPSFQEVALKYGTDKVTTHKYQFMYEKYLNPLQGKKLKMLEIGLGCNMVSPCGLYTPSGVVVVRSPADKAARQHVSSRHTAPARRTTPG